MCFIIFWKLGLDVSAYSNCHFGCIPRSAFTIPNHHSPFIFHFCCNIFSSDYLRLATHYCTFHSGKIFEIGSTGISTLGGHTEKRTNCVDRFVAEFGRMPLVPTSVKAVDSRNIWFWWFQNTLTYSPIKSWSNENFHTFRPVKVATVLLCSSDV